MFFFLFLYDFVITLLPSPQLCSVDVFPPCISTRPEHKKNQTNMGALSSPPMCWIDKTVNVPDCVWINTFPLSPPVGFCFLFLFFFFVLVRHVCCVQAPFHCTEAFNAESATRVMLLMFITLSIFCQVLWQTHSGNALLIQSFSVMKCVHENRPRSALFFGFFLYVWVRVRVCSSVPPSLFVHYELSISASRRVWEEQIDPQTPKERMCGLHQRLSKRGKTKAAPGF